MNFAVRSRPGRGSNVAARLLTVLVLSMVAWQAAEARQSASGTFAFSNARGSALLALSPWEGPERALVAFCEGSTRVPVAFATRQTSTSDDNGHALADNFNNRGGDRFDVTEGTTPPDASCFLATGDLATAEPVPVQTIRGLCTARLAAAIADARSRAAVSCVRMGAVVGTASLYTVQFEFRGDSGLAAVVLVDDEAGGDLAFLDLPAEREEWGDAWRVGDGGEFHGEHFTPLFALRGADGLLVAIGWAGAEGESLMLLQPRGDVLDEVGLGYRYWY